ncbi:unknown [Candidatus Colimorpha enterica]|uniref:Uncharacterized protein n=1 Tax=Candidatus Colimorpha enterica TaxID=3083063 RepID=R6TT50_9BACT|nr:unknown [Candidatus Colimorpha enterica]
MNVIDRSGKLSYRGNRLDPLPDKVRRVEVCAEGIADSRADLQHCLGIVNAEAGMHFKRDPCNTVRLCKLRCLLPVRDKHVVPLPLKDLRVIVRPRAGHPVRIFRPLAVAGAAGEGDNGVDLKLFGKKNGIPEIRVVHFSGLPVGMDGIAVSRKRADVDVICVEGLSELKERCFVLEKHGGVALGFPRIPARAYLDGVNAERFHFCKHLFKGLVVIKICKYAEFHIIRLLSFRVQLLSKR